ncbi:succinate dehydrogenase flavin-adding protein (antitoxin of CptAB toxin-antitoxin module) [Chryseobacterium sediminis]|uniref:Succinate dehydrogenase flavin-adding protein (Antitoxin of CptAB toxin-antitoxin module) n=1 Tax=Chryseobacterium sediminis TaxID=1679494 RepID=A0ABR6Q699_9FLAO|nr:hypothetical protein [Chryseobacterium sediminis]MBB6332974.1 succinate dehydrogenase flavin-adding protein (antitoxin of CptAB toxin-antitoxin module) [Chryseobacterium sediminis]
MKLSASCISLFSEEWKDKYKAILEQEHLEIMGKNIQKFKENTLELHLPYFNEEIIIDRQESFEKFITILESNDPDEVKIKLLEAIPFEHWLNILGQRLTSASIRDENAIPPLKSTLINACQEPFNNEITIAQRAWEKHIGRMDDDFWGEIKGNNQQKQEKVMTKIHDILDNRTWWNVFFHYKHELVFEVREKEGHGIRWSHGGTKLIGFLEKFINE